MEKVCITKYAFLDMSNVLGRDKKIFRTLDKRKDRLQNLIINLKDYFVGT